MRRWTLILLGALFSALSAQDAVDPYSDFALHVAEVAKQQNVNVSTWTGGFTNYEPPGGQIFRGFYDFNGDGLEDLILLSSVNVPYASIYRNLGANGFSKITDEAILYNFNFAVSKEGELIQVTSIAHESYFANVAINSFSPNSSLSVSRTSFDGKVADSIDLAKYGTPEEAQNTQKITMIELLLAQDPKWTDANPNLRLNGQDYELPDSLENALHTFTPESVIARTKQSESVQSSAAGNEKSEGSTATPVQQIKSVESPTPTVAPETQSPSGFPIVPVAILAAVIAGTAVFFLRRKRP